MRWDDHHGRKGSYKKSVKLPLNAVGSAIPRPLLRMKVRQEYCRKLCGNCYTESEYIFVNDMGAPYQPNYVTQHFKLILRKNHLRNIRFHDLRHTCASLLLKNGVPMKDIQEWLGHSSYNTTANIYAHLDTSSKNTSASKMSNVVIIEPGISTSV